jgi:hypothetical protein
MHGTNLPASNQDLEHVCEQFESWRRNRRKKERIPDYLWDAAVKLAGRYRLSIISSVLRVNYSDLRNRIYSEPTSSSVNTCSFVEVDVTGKNGSYPYTIDLEDRFGSRMKISCSGGSVINSVELIRVFKE